ncbi:MAG: DUF2786 domain-containing protein [Polyangiales bacterium]
MEEAREKLSAELEAAALRALGREWEHCNWTYFRSVMRKPTFGLVDTRAQMARWVRTARHIEFARPTLLDHPWGVVVEVLKHEMAHQYVDEVLGRHDETAHGPAFRKVCDDRGFDARAAGIPTAAGARGAEETAVLERIRKLLALAESPDEHEAQAAMNAAQRLMLKYNLDAVTKRVPGSYGYRHLGVPSGRVDESQRMLAVILSEHFFVETIWVPVWRVRDGRAGSVLEVCGSAENLEMAEYVHSFLHHTAEALWTLHKRRHRVDGDRDRRAYRAGVMSGFFEKLNAERANNKEKGLVWVGDPALEGFYRGRHPRIRMTRRAGSAGSDAHAHGREAGKSIVLRKGVSGGPSGGGGLLGPGGGR